MLITVTLAYQIRKVRTKATNVVESEDSNEVLIGEDENEEVMNSLLIFVAS